MQNLFNELNLIDRAYRRGYDVERLDWMPAPPPLPRGTITVLLRFIAPQRTVFFDVHAYLASEEDRVIIEKSGLLDPKHIVLHETVRMYVPGT